MDVKDKVVVVTGASSGIGLAAVREELKKDNIVVSVVYPYVTLTDFENLRFKPDTAEYLAEKILEGIKSEEAEIFAHDWMEKQRK